MSQAVSARHSGTGNTAPGSFSQRSQLILLFPWLHQREAGLLHVNGLELVSLLPTPHSVLSPSRSQLVRSPQGTLDVFILIRLSLVVTFKPKQSSGTDREGGLS